MSCESCVNYEPKKIKKKVTSNFCNTGNFNLIGGAYVVIDESYNECYKDYFCWDLFDEDGNSLGWFKYPRGDC